MILGGSLLNQNTRRERGKNVTLKLDDDPEKIRLNEEGDPTTVSSNSFRRYVET